MCAFFLSETAKRYAWCELARRAGCVIDSQDNHGFARLGLNVFYESPPLPGKSGGQPALYIVPVDPTMPHALLAQTSAQIDWLSTDQVLPPGAYFPIQGKIPILLWGAGHTPQQPFAELREDGVLIIYADILATTFIMLSRWEETINPARDEYGRFLGISSLAYAHQFIDRPIVDEYGLILRAWLQKLFPGWKPQPGHFSLQLSHDIDHVSLSFKKRIHLLAGDIFQRHDPLLSLHTLRYTLFHPWLNPFIEGLHLLADLSSKYQLNSIFFFMASEPGRYDSGYNIGAPEIRKELNQLVAQGYSIGLHPSFRTLEDPQQVAVQKSRLEQQLGDSVTVVRQHYLRIDVLRTWSIWEEAGFKIDSSLGFTDMAGFRAGTCWPFSLYDINQDRVTTLQEQPLVLMERTLLRAGSLSDVYGRILELAQRCQAVEGNFTLLWHNSSLWHIFRKWLRLYQRILPELKSLEELQPPD